MLARREDRMLQNIYSTKFTIFLGHSVYRTSEHPRERRDDEGEFYVL